MDLSRHKTLSSRRDYAMVIRDTENMHRHSKQDGTVGDHSISRLACVLFHCMIVIFATGVDLSC